MSTWKTYTMKGAHLFTTLAVTIVGIVDLWYVCVTGTGSTVSNFMVNVGFNSPPVVFMVAFLCGHLFGVMKEKSSEVSSSTTSVSD